MAGYQEKIQFAINTKNQLIDALKDKGLNIQETDNFRVIVNKLADYLSGSGEGPSEDITRIFPKNSFRAKTLEEMQVSLPNRWYKLFDITPEIDWTEFCKAHKSVNYFYNFFCADSGNFSEIYLNNLDISGLTKLQKYFADFTSLKKIDFTGIKGTENITDIYRLFYGCRNLEYINFGNSFNTDNITNISEMLYTCSKLKEIRFSPNWFPNPSITTFDISYSSVLSKESILDLASKISDRSDTSKYPSTYRVYSTRTLKNQFTEEEQASIAAQFNAKNWTLSW